MPRGRDFGDEARRKSIETRKANALKRKALKAQLEAQRKAREVSRQESIRVSAPKRNVPLGPGDFIRRPNLDAKIKEDPLRVFPANTRPAVIEKCWRCEREARQTVEWKLDGIPFPEDSLWWAFCGFYLLFGLMFWVDRPQARIAFCSGPSCRPRTPEGMPEDVWEPEAVGTIVSADGDCTEVIRLNVDADKYRGISNMEFDIFNPFSQR